jgi:Arc/MetJ-type ribon-helix-helix transcriptional regulator
MSSFSDTTIIVVLTEVLHSCYTGPMELKVSQNLQRSIQRHLDRGDFSTPEEVMQAALAQLDDYDETIEDIQASFGDEQAGRVRSLNDVDASLREKYGFNRPL